MEKSLSSEEVTPEEAFDKLSSLLSSSKLNRESKALNEIKNQIALAVRELSLSSWNIHAEIESAIKFIRISNSVITEVEIKAIIAKDITELNKIKAQDDAKQVLIDIRGDEVVINSKVIRYKQFQINTKDVVRFRHGVYIHNRMDSSYTIGFGDCHGNSIEIECHRMLSSTANIEKRYQELVKNSYDIVVPFLLKNLERQLKAGQTLQIGDISLTKENISYEKGALFWKKKHTVSWEELRFSIWNRELNVYATHDLVSTLNIKGTWNAVAFELIKKFIILK